MRLFRASSVGTLVCLLAAVLAVTMHGPGATTYDSSSQLYEAVIGKSVSWNPPFMSALLRWLGGGVAATTSFVLLNVVITYASLASSFWGYQRPGVARITLALLLIVNPFIFFYTGIVWKDVLFATWLVAVSALILGALVTPSRGGVCVAIIALLMCAPGPLIRQQGVVVAPLLALGPLYLLWVRAAVRPSTRVAMAVVTVAVCLVINLSIDRAVKMTIQASGSKAMSVGANSIEFFDITGIAARLPDADASRELGGLDAANVKRLRELYTPARADFALNDPALSMAIWGQYTPEARSHLWRKLIVEHPLLYLRHRAAVFYWLAGMGGIWQCVPMAVGVDGSPEFLAAAGMTPGISVHARTLSEVERPIVPTPVFRGWLYIALLVIASAVTLVRRKGQVRVVLAIELIALWAFVGGFLPTAIACDVRYLYPLVPAVTMILLFLLLRRQAPPVPKAALL